MQHIKMKDNSLHIQVLVYALFFVTIIAINSGNTSISQAAYILILLSALFGSLENTILIVFCIIPFPRVFLLSGSFSTLLPLLQIIIAVKSIKGWKIHAFKPIQFLFYMFLFCYSSLIEFLRYGTYLQTIEYCIMIFAMIVVSSSINEKIRNKCFVSFVISSLLSATVGYFFPSVGKYTSLYFTEFNTRFQGLLGDPGEFGQYMVCAFAMCISLYFMYKGKHKKWLLIITIGLCTTFLAFIILSGTRASLVALEVVYLVMMVWLLKDKKSSTRIIGIILFIVTVFLLGTISSYLFNIISASHGGELLASDNRTEIWMGYLSAFGNDVGTILFGAGMNSSSKYGSIYGFGNPHNIFIEKMIECGIVGFILNFFVYYFMLKRKKLTISNYSSLPFYAFLSTLLFYGSVGIILPYLLLAMLDEKSITEKYAVSSY